MIERSARCDMTETNSQSYPEQVDARSIGLSLLAAGLWLLAAGTLAIQLAIWVPSEERFFRQTGIRLPGLTKLIVDFSRSFRGLWIVCFPIVLVPAVIFVSMRNRMISVAGIVGSVGIFGIVALVWWAIHIAYFPIFSLSAGGRYL